MSILQFRLKAFPRGEELPQNAIKNFKLVEGDVRFLIETDYMITNTMGGNSYFDYGQYCKNAAASLLQNQQAI